MGTLRSRHHSHVSSITPGFKYSAAIQPYALKLFFALFLIDIIVTWIQYSAEASSIPLFFSVA